MTLEFSIFRQKVPSHILDTNPSNFIIYNFNRRMPNCTTVVQTAGDFLNPKFD